MADPAHLVAAGGIVGATLRHVVGEAVERGSVPTGTLTVNVLGSLLLGFVVSAGVGEGALLLVGTGVCGSFTTFSSFAVATVSLWEDDERAMAVAYALANVVGALAAVGVGRLLATLLVA